MRNYQRKKNREPLPHAVYMQVRYKIIDYDRLKRERLCILHGSAAPPDGMPRGNKTSNPTEQKAIKLAYIDKELEAIEQSAIEIMGIMSNKVHDEFNSIKAYWSYDYFNYMHIRRSDTDNGPSRRTWNYFKDEFSKKIAERLKIF
ncbi:MAG TPA: hypothetical protein DIC60_01130 [Lachnospiraceae bacterium]|nr:hypothetical protein [Lachnospiraceae bacterium]